MVGQQYEGVPPSSLTLRAQSVAQERHRDQVDRHGRPVVEHLERVAARVPPSARPVAYVHDVCERSPLSPADVAGLVGLDEDELEALELLTKRRGEPLWAHTRRVRDATGGPGRELAVTIKRADLEDHANHAQSDSQYAAAIDLLETERPS
ncbi:hypothetical protein AB0L40_24260 [Patulibacter sp. NPDC049589]|uniref:hypothetical protein n=1 Tax=Patulibacter sp. NPDC049589 TaxID=3154731 RepID=UPI003433C8DE